MLATNATAKRVLSFLTYILAAQFHAFVNGLCLVFVALFIFLFLVVCNSFLLFITLGSIPIGTRCAVFGIRRSICLYRCECLVGIDVTCACAITKFSESVFDVAELDVWIGHVFVGVARCTIRHQSWLQESDFLVVLFVTGDACRSGGSKIVEYISWRDVCVCQQGGPICGGVTNIASLIGDEVRWALGHGWRMRAVMACSASALCFTVGKLSGANRCPDSINMAGGAIVGRRHMSG